MRWGAMAGGLLFLLGTGAAWSAEVARVATASNFAAPLKRIARAFETKTGVRIVVIPASTGKLYAQIKNGAPFDLFLAADADRPQRLEAEGLTEPGSRFTYAVGRLALWRPAAGTAPFAGWSPLENADGRRLAIANPKTAPYGRAAIESLKALGMWELWKGRLVRGENIGQTHQFAAGGGVDLGFIALSQLLRPGASVQGAWKVVPQALHDPIIQQAVLLKGRPREGPAGRFWTFLQGPEARKIMAAFGYAFE